ncbi:MAG: TlpA family protein disulfide reductase [Desulfobacteraceae bacterium]|nr:TlpA family protein disulfide reductase [Desulfobacteraceae bacterium]
MKNNIIVIICIFLLFSCKENTATDPLHQKSAPDFRLEDINHQRFYLNQHKGKIVIIVFWATWCKVCKAYLNALENVNPEFKDKDIKLVSIVVDPENTDTLSELLKTSIKVSYPILLDRNKHVTEKFSVNELPTTIIISQKNKIVLVKQGYTPSTITQIQNKLTLLLENEK